MVELDDIRDYIYELDRREFENILGNSVLLEEQAHIYFVKRDYENYVDVIVINCDKLKNKETNEVYYVETEFLKSPEYRSWSRKERSIEKDETGQIPDKVNFRGIEAQRVDDNTKLIEKQSWPDHIKEKFMNLLD